MIPSADESLRYKRQQRCLGRSLNPPQDFDDCGVAQGIIAPPPPEGERCQAVAWGRLQDWYCDFTGTSNTSVTVAMTSSDPAFVPDTPRGRLRSPAGS